MEELPLCEVKISKVLAALDLSAYSEITFSHALTLARKLDAELILLNVINSRGLDTLDKLQAEGYDISSQKYIDTLQSERSQEFEKDYLSRVGSVPTRLIFRVGVPYQEIIKAIGEEGCDLVVMGTKGRTDIIGTLFGTTAEKVFRRATCPVVSVRGPEHCRLPAA